MGDEPGAGEEREGDEKDAVAFCRELLPALGLEIIECCQGDAGEQAVEPGPGRIIDIHVVSSAEGFGFRDDVVPHIGADGETEEEEGGQDINGLLVSFYRMQADDEQGQEKVELFFDTKRPGVAEGAFFTQVQSEILGEREHPPEWRQLAAFFKAGYGDIKCEYSEKGRQDAQRAFEIELAIGDPRVFCDLREELAADEEAAEHEEEVDAGPAPAAKVLVQSGGMAEHAVMIYEYDNNSKGAEVIQAGEAVGGGGLHGKGYEWIYYL